MESTRRQFIKTSGGAGLWLAIGSSSIQTIPTLLAQASTTVGSIGENERIAFAALLKSFEDQKSSTVLFNRCFTEPALEVGISDSILRDPASRLLTAHFGMLAGKTLPAASVIQEWKLNAGPALVPSVVELLSSGQSTDATLIRNIGEAFTIGPKSEEILKGIGALLDGWRGRSFVESEHATIDTLKALSQQVSSGAQGEIGAAISVLGSVLSRAGVEPGVVRTIVTVASIASSTVFLTTEGTLLAMGPVGWVAAVGLAVGAIFGLFGGDSGPSPFEDQVLKQLNAIQDSLARIQKFQIVLSEKIDLLQKDVALLRSDVNRVREIVLYNTRSQLLNERINITNALNPVISRWKPTPIGKENIKEACSKMSDDLGTIAMDPKLTGDTILTSPTYLTDIIKDYSQVDLLLNGFLVESKNYLTPLTAFPEKAPNLTFWAKSSRILLLGLYKARRLKELTPDLKQTCTNAIEECISHGENIGKLLSFLTSPEVGTAMVNRLQEEYNSYSPKLTKEISAWVSENYRPLTSGFGSSLTNIASGGIMHVNGMAYRRPPIFSLNPSCAEWSYSTDPEDDVFFSVFQNMRSPGGTNGPRRVASWLLPPLPGRKIGEIPLEQIKTPEGDLIQPWISLTLETQGPSLINLPNQTNWDGVLAQLVTPRCGYIGAVRQAVLDVLHPMGPNSWHHFDATSIKFEISAGTYKLKAEQLMFFFYNTTAFVNASSLPSFGLTITIDEKGRILNPDIVSYFRLISRAIAFDSMCNQFNAPDGNGEDKSAAICRQQPLNLHCFMICAMSSLRQWRQYTDYTETAPPVYSTAESYPVNVESSLREILPKNGEFGLFAPPAQGEEDKALVARWQFILGETTFDQFMDSELKRLVLDRYSRYADAPKLDDRQMPPILDTTLRGLEGFLHAM